MRCNPSGLTSHRPAATPVTRAALRDCTHHWLNAIFKILKDTSYLRISKTAFSRGTLVVIRNNN